MTGRPRGHNGVVSISESGTARVGHKGMCRQALSVCGGGCRCVCRAAVCQVCESVCVDSWGYEGVRSQRPIVAVPLFVALV